MLAFGFNRCQQTDRLRVEHMQKLYNCEVITVSESNTENKEHINTRFGSRRSSKYLSKEIQRIIKMKSDSGSTYANVVAFLDYFWLEQNYYRSNYKTDWLCGWNNSRGTEYNTCKARESVCFYLLSAGVNTIYLPNGIKDESLEAMVRQYNIERKEAISIYNLQWIDMQDNPIWSVTDSLETGASNDPDKLYSIFGDRGSNTYQTNTYLKPKKSFLKVELYS